MKSFAWLMLVLSANAFAKISITSTSDAIKLTGASCAELQQEARAISDWKMVTEKVPSKATKVKCISISGGFFEIDISDLIPSFIRPVYGKCAQNWGPNCWNASLVSAGLAFTLRFSDSTEFHNHMTSPLCRQLKSEDKALPGDIVAIRSKTTRNHEDQVNKGFFGESAQESHAYVYISEQLCFSKNDNSPDTTYTIQGPSEVENLYKLTDPKCRALKSREIPKECAIYSQIYRCQSLNEFWKANPMLEEKYACYFDSLEKIEKTVSHYTINVPKNKCPDPKTFLVELDELLRKFESMKPEQEWNLDEEYIRRGFYYINESLHK